MKKRRTSIKWELSFFIVALLLPVIAALSLFMLNAQKKALTNEVKLRGLSITRNLATNMADFLLTEDDLGIAKILAETVNNKGVKYAFVVDENNRIRAHNDMERIGEEYRKPEKTGELGGEEEGIFIFNAGKEGRIIDFSATALAKGRADMGKVHVGISYSLIEDVINKAYLNVVLVAVPALILGIIGAVLLGMAIAKPIGTLAEGAKIVGTGNLGHEIKVKSANEIGELAAIFNMMTKDLKHAQESVIKQQRLEKELEVARQIQLALVPEKIDEIKGYDVSAYYSPAKEVGGDYYDVLRLGKGMSGFVMADVSGKGIPAAFVMTMARAILHSEASPDIDSKDTLKALNSIIFPDLKEGMYLTAFYGVLDAVKGSMEISSAGHNNTLVLNGKTGEVIPYNPKGFPIGTDPGQRFDRVIKKEEIKLGKGDFVVIFTDGITEAMNGEREEFGEAKLVKIMESVQAVGASEMLDNIVKEVKKFTGSAEQSDDIAVVVIKKK